MDLMIAAIGLQTLPTGFTLSGQRLIVAMLAVMLLPALSQAKDRAHRTKYLNHLSQTGLATGLHLREFNGDFLGAALGDGPPQAEGLPDANENRAGFHIVWRAILELEGRCCGQWLTQYQISPTAVAQAIGSMLFHKTTPTDQIQ